MARKKAVKVIAPLPSAGGAYRLDKTSGQWVRKGPQLEPIPAAAPVLVTPDQTDGTDTESPAAGED